MEIREYVTRDGKAVFTEWFKKLRDRRAKNRIRSQLDRLELGLSGDCRALGGGVHELRIHYGPGYRIYFGNMDRHIVLLLCGSSKASQQRDIKLAKHFWNDYQSRI